MFGFIRMSGSAGLGSMKGRKDGRYSTGANRTGKLPRISGLSSGVDDRANRVARFRPIAPPPHYRCAIVVSGGRVRPETAYLPPLAPLTFGASTE